MLQLLNWSHVTCSNQKCDDCKSEQTFQFDSDRVSLQIFSDVSIPKFCSISIPKKITDTDLILDSYVM